MALVAAASRVQAELAIRVAGLTHAFGSRIALRELHLEVPSGEILALLGPNGSGKTTLFRLLSTLWDCQQGEVRVLGYDLRTSPHAVRARLGVMFQAPSLDKQLTVRENIRCQAALYGVPRATLRIRETELLREMELTERANERVQSLSGGLRRRVEIAKALIHRPQLLLLDEPSTGLDPYSRIVLGNQLRSLRDRYGVTIVMTTHLLDEAELADRVGILDEGRLVALGRADELKNELGRESLTVGTETAEPLAAAIRQRYGVAVTVRGPQLRIAATETRSLLPALVADC
jgi:ABC-2 type transport system ATP-binding protein